MLGILLTVMAFLLAVFVVVVIHELGHYSAARYFGMPVLRFSFGFGRQLFSRTDSRGTEWAFSLIPLGGYVKLLDMESLREQGGSEEDAFENQPLGRRAVVMAGGPLANFVLAFAIYLALTMQGETGLKPIIDKVYPGTPAASAGFERGEQVVSVDGEPIRLWKHFTRHLLLAATDASTLAVGVGDQSGLALFERTLDLGDVDPSILDRDLMREIGLRPDTSFITREIDLVVDGSPAQAAGMMVGDVLLEIDGLRLDNWEEVVDEIEGRPGRRAEFAVRRDGEILRLQVDIAAEEVEGETVGKIGVRPGFDEARLEALRRSVSYGFADAVGQAASWTYGGLVVTVRFIKFLFTGQVSTKNLAGPIRIANYASDSLLQGLVSFLGFLAAISISLGVVNLLPIPILDGGHLMLYAVEFARGKKLSARATSFLYGVGGALVLAFMAFAVVNDLMRL